MAQFQDFSSLTFQQAGAVCSSVDFTAFAIQCTLEEHSREAKADTVHLLHAHLGFLDVQERPERKERKKYHWMGWRLVRFMNC